MSAPISSSGITAGDRVSLARIGALAVGAAAWLGLPLLPLAREAADLRNAVNVLAGADATMLGFLVSSGALIFAVAQTTLVRNLYRMGHIQRFLHALFFDAAIFLSALTVALASLLLPERLNEAPLLWHAVRALLALNAAALWALVPVGYTLLHLLLNVGPKDKVLEREPSLD